VAFCYYNVIEKKVCWVEIARKNPSRRDRISMIMASYYGVWNG